jgi:DNA-binding NarL/FixJ family response regulator
VLTMLAEGLGNKEIARQLDISDNTVKFHLASIFGKLGANSRTEAVMQGMRHGLIMV